MITSLNPLGPGDSSHDSTGSKTLFVQGSLAGPLVLYAKAAGGNWSSPNTWSITGSGGADNSGPPDATQPYDVIFEAGSGNVTIDADASCRSLDCTAGAGSYIGTLTHNAFNLKIGHTSAPPSNVSLKFSIGMTYVPVSTSSIITLTSTVVTSVSIITANKTLGALTASGLTGSWAQIGSITITGFLILSGGTYNTNSNTITAQGIAFTGSTANLGSSQINLTRTTAGNIVTATAGTINAGNSEMIVVNASSSARTFAGGGKVYYNLTYIVAGSSGGLIITGANTFHDLKFSDAISARTLTMPSGSTTTITGVFGVNGTSSNLMTVVGSSTGVSAPVSKASGIVSCDYLSLKDNPATGGATWYAGANSIDNGNNAGWFFTAAPGGGAGVGQYLLLVKAGQ
jgi:hypothetical protein